MATSVMVIDDDRDIRFVIRMNLEAEGYDVHECADGAAAVEAIGTTMPDIIVCDIMMPGIDGYGVLEHLKSTRRRATSRSSSCPPRAATVRSGKGGSREPTTTSPSPSTPTSCSRICATWSQLPV